MNREKIKIATSSKPAERAGEALNNILKQRQGDDILLLLSGGSAFSLLDYVRAELIGPHVTIGMFDERYSSDPAINNFLQLKKTNFYVSAREKDASIIDTSIAKGESAEDLARRLEFILREWREENPKGVIIATFGIGEDGHTAGVLPLPESSKKFDELFDNPERWAVSYEGHGKISCPRVTTTLSFVRENITHAIVYAVGEAKRVPISKLLASSGTLSETPARILRELSDVTIFTDLKFK